VFNNNQNHRFVGITVNMWFVIFITRFPEFNRLTRKNRGINDL
jgi:hypothetical protein